MFIYFYYWLLFPHVYYILFYCCIDDQIACHVYGLYKHLMYTQSIHIHWMRVVILADGILINIAFALEAYED